MEIILREEYLKVLAAIYYHIVKEHGRADIDTLSNELSINKETLKDYVSYLSDEGYIYAKKFPGQTTGTIADFRIISVYPKGRDIIEDPFRFAIGNELININNNIINIGGDLSMQGSSISQSNVSNISIENINVIEKLADSLAELVSEEELKKEIRESKDDLKKGNFESFKTKMKGFYNSAIHVIDGVRKFVTLVLTIAKIVTYIPH